MTTPDVTSQWLTVELDRLWHLGERAYRALQRAQLRPQSNHPMVAELEAILAARARARTEVPGEQVADLPGLRKQTLFGRVVENLQLRPLEAETLLVTMAPHLDPALATMFNHVKGPCVGRRGVDLELIAQLLHLRGKDRVALLDALDPERPLLRWRLIGVQPAESFEAYTSMSLCALRPTFDVVSLLCGRRDLAPELSRHATLGPPRTTLERLRLDADARAEIARVCRAAAKSTGRYDIVLWGGAGAGKRTVASCIAGSAGRLLLALDLAQVERARLDDVLSCAQREALVRDALLYVGPLAGAMLDDGGATISTRLRYFRGSLVLGVETTRPPRLMLTHPVTELHVRAPSTAVREQLWHDALASESLAADVQLPDLASSFHLTPGEIECCARDALVSTQYEHVGHVDVRRAIERRLRNDLGELAQRITRRGSWSDLVLPPQHMARLEELISRKRHQETVYGTWGFGERVGYGRGLIALLSGPPGTGKTMLASLIAQALDLELYQIDLGLVVSKWVGETEKQLGRVFDNAQRAHAVLLFDEADSLFAKRTDVKQANDRFANMATNYLLQRLEQYTGVAVLTTNKDTALDEALHRRLTLHLRLDLPEVAERQRLWQSFLPARTPTESDIDLDALAQEFELSGGYIKNAALRAAFLAASAGVPVGMDLLRLASALELEDMGRVVCHGGG